MAVLRRRLVLLFYKTEARALMEAVEKMEIRKHDDEIDEVLVKGVDFHLEYMDDGIVWIGLSHPCGRVDHVNLFTKRGAKIMCRVDENA